MSIRIVLLIVLFAGCSQHRHEAENRHSEAGQQNPAALPLASTSPVRGDLYYFDDCPVCRRLLGTQGDPVTHVADGRQIRFCKSNCASAFTAAFSANLEALDQRMSKDQAMWYPITTSVVSGLPLSQSPLDFVWGNRLIRVNGAEEKATFLRQPEKYFNVLTHEAILARWQKYPVTKCPVQGRALGDSFDEELAVVIGYRIVRVCCDDCARLVREHPNHYLPIIDLANRMGNVK